MLAQFLPFTEQNAHLQRGARFSVYLYFYGPIPDFFGDHGHLQW